MKREERSKMVTEYYERNPEAKQRISDGLKKYHSENTMPEETRKKMSEASKERMNRPEVKAKYSKLFKGKKRPKEVAEKIAKANRARRGQTISEETRQKMSEAAKKAETHNNVPSEVRDATLEKNHNRIVPVEERLRKSGENNYNSKITDDQAREIIALHATGDYSYQVLGDIYGMSKVAVGNLVRGKTWKHIHGELEPIDLSTRRKGRD